MGAWLGYLVIDFLTHAVFLASWWRATETYWLPPLELFRRIPFGYASFAIYCTVLAWLINRLYYGRVTLAKGLQFGAIAGIVSGIASVLGTYSAFRMPPSALAVWPVSIVLDSTIAGAIAAWVLIAERPWRRVAAVCGIALVLFILGVVVQNLFLQTPTDHLLRSGGI
jgi:hypothetical protein